MVNALMRKYALSRQGAVDYIKACVAGTVVNLVKMFPVSLLYILVDTFVSGKSNYNYLFYILCSLGILIVMYLTNYTPTI